MKLKLQLVLNELLESYLKFVNYKISANNPAVSNINRTIGDQIEYLKIKFKSFIIEINYIMKQLSEESTNQLTPMTCFTSIGSTLIELIVIYF